MAMTRGRRLRALGAMLVLTLIGWTSFDAPGALAETRRAFVLGVKNYASEPFSSRPPFSDTPALLTSVVIVASPARRPSTMRQDRRGS